MENKGKRWDTKNMVLMALFAGITCVLAPLSVPIGPVPISLTNLVIYFSIFILGWRRATITYLVYLLIGMAGLPVFSGFESGVGKFAGPTGGYLVGERFVYSGTGRQSVVEKRNQLYRHGSGNSGCLCFWNCLVLLFDGERSLGCAADLRIPFYNR